MLTRGIGFVLMVSIALTAVRANEAADLPSNPKAQKTYQEGLEYLSYHALLRALESFKSADKQDGGHCIVCQRQIIECGVKIHEWKDAERAAEAIVGETQSTKDLAQAHFALGVILMEEGLARHKEEPYERAHEQMSMALTAYPNFPMALFNDGVSLAHANQDSAAKAQFERFVSMVPANYPNRHYAMLFLRHPELAKATQAPPFAVTTLDGRRLTLDDLRGKVVLIDFWATWCGPCQDALPHIQAISKKFQGKPLVILSVSLDRDKTKWQKFVVKHAMDWSNYWDGGFDGPMAQLFGVQAIPHTFTVDADGLLQNEAIGDSAIDGKLKKLVARALEQQDADLCVPQSVVAPGAGTK